MKEALVLLDEYYYRQKFELDKAHAFPVAIQLIQEVTINLPLEEQERAISIIKKIAEEYGIEIDDCSERGVGNGR
ncbi:hypothetical protein MKY98_26715 [Paenibacillus sp. FSL M8-0228]|jgi:hypothetical protein|uniref:hypothetical protein n=1 Tax=Paenibacillus TaxID=44249 RepID=UPI00083CB920|nr:hypothetical protein [Paenibacillus polymyxa]MBO3287573.1 hypothetical protein [Paenibacillus polymyxa]ODB54935.1 hypothetical protein A7311_20885 [Paenibacillus polymyxa]